MDPMTRKFAPYLVVCAVILSLAALAQTGNAAPTPASAPPATANPGTVPSRVGIINIQQAIVATNEGQRDFDALQKKFEPKQAELQKLNTEVDDLKKQLQTQGDKLNEESRVSLQKSLESKQTALERTYQDAQKDAQEQQQALFNRIGQKMMPVLDKYAKANGYTVIIDVSSPQTPVLWADLASTDVTKAIVDAYNAQSGVAAPAKPATTGAAKTPSGTNNTVRKPVVSAPTTNTPASAATPPK